MAIHEKVSSVEDALRVFSHALRPSKPMLLNGAPVDAVLCKSLLLHEDVACDIGLFNIQFCVDRRTHAAWVAVNGHTAQINVEKGVDSPGRMIIDVLPKSASTRRRPPLRLVLQLPSTMTKDAKKAGLRLGGYYERRGHGKPIFVYG